MTNTIRLGMSWLVLSIVFGASTLYAQETPAPTDADAAPAAAETEAAPASQRTLRDDQEALRMRFARFEETLAKMARYLQKTEPARAELVFRALSRSKAERVAERMTLTSRLLSKDEGDAPQFAEAMSEQEAILAELREILKILRSEDILDENKAEQERLKELARQINVLIDQEKINQAQTDRGERFDRAADAQEKTADQTDELIGGIKAHDAKAKVEDGEKGREGEGEKDPKETGDPKGEQEPKENGGEKAEDSEKSGDSKGEEKSEDPSGESSEKSPMGDQKSGDQKSGDQNSGEQKSGESQQSPMGEPSEQNQLGSPSENQPPQGQPQQGQPQQGQPQQGQPQQGQPQQGGSQQQSQQQTPGREELEQARDRMEQAIKELQEQNRENASKEQEEAIQKLIEAKERVEEMLRQLREEERELLLRALEARFQKMHQLQQVVLASTEALHETGKENWQDRDYAQVRDAAATEREIGIEADKALEILRADGSSVAFPEAVRQIRADVTEVAHRLGEEDAGELTITIEKDILAALEEMIEALQKEMQELREKKDQKSQQQQGEPTDPGLVDKIAELKMLKTLQLRINRRTKTLGELFEGEQATKPDVISQLQELSERQGRLQRATYDLSIGKTDN